ncbi:MAG: hypothetical protein KJP06_05835 [Deltaproteobacteria bacterium]|nr:hypothetical protein [Deltaproteobacteria bacterium]
MDLEIFDQMRKKDLKNYIQFLLWHYRVIDAFWYLNISAQFDESTADRLNEQVWGKAAAMAARDLHERFNITDQGLAGFVKTLKYFPWCIIVGYQISETPEEVMIHVPECPTQTARTKRGLNEYACKAMHQEEFSRFAREINPQIQVECLFAPPDPHPDDMMCKWRFFIGEA